MSWGVVVVVVGVVVVMLVLVLEFSWVVYFYILYCSCLVDWRLFSSVFYFCVCVWDWNWNDSSDKRYTHDAEELIAVYQLMFLVVIWKLAASFHHVAIFSRTNLICEIKPGRKMNPTSLVVLCSLVAVAISLASATVFYEVSFLHFCS